MNAQPVLLDSVQPHTKGTTVAGEVDVIKQHTASALAAVRAIGTTADAFAALTLLAETLAGLAGTVAGSRGWLVAELLDSGQCKSMSDAAGFLGISKTRVQQLAAAGRKAGNPMKDPGTQAEPAVVAVAIVLHPDGHTVLMEHRPDGDPPWTFPAAEIFPGESPAHALMRRVPEETGIKIIVDHVIGSRPHPRNGRFMRYLLCRPALPETADSAAHQAGDKDADLVRWVSMPMVHDLAPDLFVPVRQLLEFELSGD